jgi:HNH endonuclease
MENILDRKIESIAKMYYEDLKPLRQIATELGVSAPGIQKALKRNGYDTSKAALNLKVKCKYCEKEFTRTRGKIRKAIEIFCSNECYYTYLKILNETNIINRYGQIKSRSLMYKFYGELPEGSIVHHIDGDDTNTEITNLVLLKTQADHIMIHRNYGEPKILFDGRKFELELSKNQYLELSDDGNPIHFGFNLVEVVLKALEILNKNPDKILKVGLYSKRSFDSNYNMIPVSIQKIHSFGKILIQKNNDVFEYKGFWED